MGSFQAAGLGVAALVEVLADPYQVEDQTQEGDRSEHAAGSGLQLCLLEMVTKVVASECDGVALLLAGGRMGAWVGEGAEAHHVHHVGHMDVRLEVAEVVSCAYHQCAESNREGVVQTGEEEAVVLVDEVVQVSQVQEHQPTEQVVHLVQLRLLGSDEAGYPAGLAEHHLLVLHHFVHYEGG